jgi:hypothetical protein
LLKTVHQRLLTGTFARVGAVARRKRQDRHASGIQSWRIFLKDCHEDLSAGGRRLIGRGGDRGEDERVEITQRDAGKTPRHEKTREGWGEPAGRRDPMGVSP